MMSAPLKKRICPFFENDLCLLGDDCKLAHQLPLVGRGDGHSEEEEEKNSCPKFCAPPTPPPSEAVKRSTPPRAPKRTVSVLHGSGDPSAPPPASKLNPKAPDFQAQKVSKKVDKLNPEAPDFQPKTASRLEKNTAWMMTNAELRRENVELRGSLDDLEKRMKRLMSVPPPGHLPTVIMCAFCENPGHVMKSAGDGRVTCPKLLANVCSRCGAVNSVADQVENGPLLEWGGLHYPDDWQVFVGNLPQSCTQADLADRLHSLFGAYGKVVHVRVANEWFANQSRHAFVLFETAQAAQRVLSCKGGNVVLGDHSLNVHRCTKTMVRKREGTSK